MIMRMLKNGEVFEVDDLENYSAEMPPAPPTDADRIAALEEQNEMLTECILELSELLYA